MTDTKPTMNTDKVLALAHQAGMNATDGNNAVSIRFAKLIQREMVADGWRQCAEGQGTTQYCGIAESWELIMQVQAKLKEKNT